MPDKILLFHQKSSHNAFRPHIFAPSFQDGWQSCNIHVSSANLLRRHGCTAAKVHVQLTELLPDKFRNGGKPLDFNRLSLQTVYFPFTRGFSRSRGVQQSSYEDIILFQGVQSQESSASIQILESRQEDILCELNGLKAAVEEMASRLGVSLPRQKAKVRHELTLTQSCGHFNLTIRVYMDERKKGTILRDE